VYRAELHWVEKLPFVASDSFSHSIVLDTTTDDGGSGRGIKPMELLLMALVGCMAMDIVSILKKKRADLRRLVAEIDGDRIPTDPKRFLDIRVRFQANKEVRLEDLRRSMELSRDKYCSVAGTLADAPKVVYEVAVESSDEKGGLS
jgi:putative redox protein